MLSQCVIDSIDGITLSPQAPCRRHCYINQLIHATKGAVIYALDIKGEMKKCGIPVMIDVF